MSIQANDPLIKDPINKIIKIGKLEYIYLGPMFSGKTSALIRYLTINADVGFKVVYINSQRDVRSKDTVSTHSSSGNKLSHNIVAIKVKTLASVDVSKYDVIGVDEFQFYEDQKPSEIVKKWVFSGKRVAVSGLDGDFNLNPFGSIFNLIPLCEAGGLFKMKEGICLECLKNKKEIVPGGFTKKIVNNNELVDIGGQDKYKIVCLQCHQTK